MAIQTDSYTITFSPQLARWLVSLYLIFILVNATVVEFQAVAWRAKYWLMSLEAAFWGIVASVTRRLIFMLGGRKGEIT